MAISLWTKLLWIVIVWFAWMALAPLVVFFRVLRRVPLESAIEFYYRFCTHTLLPVEYSSNNGHFTFDQIAVDCDAIKCLNGSSSSCGCFRVLWRVPLEPQMNSTTDSVLIFCYQLSIQWNIGHFTLDQIAVDCRHIICLNGSSSSCGFFRVLWRITLEPQLNSTTDSVLILCYQLSIHRTMAILLWTKLLWIVMHIVCLNGCSSTCGFFACCGGYHWNRNWILLQILYSYFVTSWEFIEQWPFYFGPNCCG